MLNLRSFHSFQIISQKVYSDVNKNPQYHIRQKELTFKPEFYYVYG